MFVADLVRRNLPHLGKLPFIHQFNIRIVNTTGLIAPTTKCHMPNLAQESLTACDRWLENLLGIIPLHLSEMINPVTKRTSE